MIWVEGGRLLKSNRRLIQVGLFEVIIERNDEWLMSISTITRIAELISVYEERIYIINNTMDLEIFNNMY
jgi:hypothetical protein